MSSPSGKHFGRCRPSGRTAIRARGARGTDAGIARGPGLLVAGVTAAIVFAIGHQLFPIKPRLVVPPPPPVQPALPPAPAQPNPGPATAAPDAAVHAAVAAADAGRVATRGVDARAASAEPPRAAVHEKEEPTAPSK